MTNVERNKMSRNIILEILIKAFYKSELVKSQKQKKMTVCCEFIQLLVYNSTPWTLSHFNFFV